MLVLPADASREVDEAKRAVMLANATAWQVNQALRPIEEQLEQWQQTYGQANTTNNDINKALMDANNTGNAKCTKVIKVNRPQTGLNMGISQVKECALWVRSADPAVCPVISALIGGDHPNADEEAGPAAEPLHPDAQHLGEH